MARVICTLPNASDCINGVRFTLDRGQMVSEEVDEDTAAIFGSIRGYSVVSAEPPPPPVKPPAVEPSGSDRPARRTAGNRRQGSTADGEPKPDREGEAEPTADDTAKAKGEGEGAPNGDGEAKGEGEGEAKAD